MGATFPRLLAFVSADVFPDQPPHLAFPSISSSDEEGARHHMLPSRSLPSPSVTRLCVTKASVCLLAPTSGYSNYSASSSPSSSSSVSPVTSSTMRFPERPIFWPIVAVVLGSYTSRGIVDAILNLYSCS